MREKLAAYAHDAWSGWMQYLFSKSSRRVDGTLTIPAFYVERWTRQMGTEYKDLPENEKASDLVEADKIIEIVEQDNTSCERIQALESVIVDLYDQINEDSLRSDTREKVEEVMKDRWRL